jgi:hypothetical protein
MRNETASRQSTFVCILTDIHFWVPVAVLIAGLLLLRSLR